MTRTCSLDDCNRPCEARGYCNAHYHRWKRYGSPHSGDPPRESHGMKHLPEYSVWRGIRRRCYSPTRHEYRHYGGRGIKMCDRWRLSFQAFYADMGPRPGVDYSINRIDNAGDYEPCNCEWATKTEQNINKGVQSNSRSGYRGVYWRTGGRGWTASVEICAARVEVTRLGDAAEAAYVRDQLALQLHGESAYLNMLR